MKIIKKFFENANIIVADIPGGSGGGAVNSVNGKTGDVVLTKLDIGLSNVDNTSDLNKPISTATQTALNNKVNKNGDTMTGNLKIQSTSGTALEVEVGGGGTDVLFKNTNNDVIFNLETTLNNKASYINSKSTSNYNGFFGFVNGLRKFFIGKQNDSDGISIYTNDGYTKTATFKDDRTTQFFGQISATNLSGTNTGDETQATIENKLGADYNSVKYNTQKMYLNLTDGFSPISTSVGITLPISGSKTYTSYLKGTFVGKNSVRIKFGETFPPPPPPPPEE